MALHSEAPDNNAIVVFLHESGANLIAGKLRGHGYAAAAVHTVPDLLVALRSGCYSLAVTTRLDIDVVRNIRAIPVVNLEVFFHTADGSSATSKEFDEKAFLDRIRALSAQRPSSNEAHDGEPETLKSTSINRLVSRCWYGSSDLLNRRKSTSAKK